MGRNLDFNATQFAVALDPQRFIDVRTGIGGVSATATGALLDELEQGIESGRTWLARARERLDESTARRQQAVERLQRNNEQPKKPEKGKE